MARQALDMIDEIKVASPCEADWSQMTGDQHARHCNACDKKVFNLIGLTRPQVLDLFAQHQEGLCVRFYQRADGKVMTADCPVGLRTRLQKRAKRVKYALAAACSWLLGIGCADAPRPGETSTEDIPETCPQDPRLVPMAGGITPPPVKNIIMGEMVMGKFAQPQEAVKK